MAAVPSWLAAMGHAKDRLWSVDLFRAESILLKSHWILVMMDVYIRRILGFGVATANLDGIQVCRMFNWAIARQTMLRHLSSDHDPLFRFQRWRATNRNYSARVFGSNLVLAAERSRTEARGLQDVLQRIDSRFLLPSRRSLPHVSCYPAAELRGGGDGEATEYGNTPRAEGCG